MCALETGLSPDEAKRFVSVACDEAGDELSVGVSLGVDSFALARELLEHAESAGASHALLGFPPTFRPTSDEDVYEPLAELCGATALAIVLPVSDALGFHRVHPTGIPWGAYGRLSGHENVKGMHVTGFLPPLVSETFRNFGGRLAVGVGAPELLGAMVPLHRAYGADWLSAGHWELWQSPDRRYVVDYLDLIVAGRIDEARELYWRLAPARGIAFGTGIARPELEGLPHWPLAKFVSYTVGGNGGQLRDPALRLKGHEIQARLSMLRSIGIEPDDDLPGFMAGRSASTA